MDDLQIPTLTGKVDYVVEQAIRTIAARSNALSSAVKQIKTTPPSLTLDQIRAALSPTGSTPLNIFQQLGGGNTSGAAVLYGLHDDRLALNTSKFSNGQLYFETDRTATYLWDAPLGSWLLVWGWMDDTAVADRPGDLGAIDAGFLFHSSDSDGLIYRWSGATWHQHIGLLRGVFSSRPVAFTGCDSGLLFTASDRGYHTWVLDFSANAWTLLEGWGGPMRGSLAGIPGTLTAHDVGFLYAATDYDRLYRWSGAAWADAPGQPARGQICAFGPQAPPTGWALCDGSVVTISTPTGGSTAITLPDLVDNGSGHACYIRGGTPYTGTPFGDGLNGSTGGDLGPGQVVQAGVGTTVAAHGHQHDLENFVGAGGSPYMPSLDIPYYCRL